MVLEAWMIACTDRFDYSLKMIWLTNGELSSQRALVFGFDLTFPASSATILTDTFGCK